MEGGGEGRERGLEKKIKCTGCDKFKVLFIVISCLRHGNIVRKSVFLCKDFLKHPVCKYSIENQFLSLIVFMYIPRI